MKLCSLCRLEPLTKEYWQTGHWKIVDCWTCGVPLVVWKKHEMTVPQAELAYILGIVEDLFGTNPALRMKQRQIPDHFHFHVLNATQRKTEERRHG